MEFSNPWILLTIPVVLLPWFIVVLAREKTRTASIAFPSFPGRVIIPSLKSRLRWLPNLFRFIVLSLLVVAISEPRIPSDEVPIYKEGIDITVVFDVSTSMRALDFEPSDRFSVARDTIADFVKERQNDRVGLVVFAGKAYTQCPLTLDHSVLLNIISMLKMGVIEDGTAIGDAMAVAINRLRDSEAKSKVILLLTDGTNNRGSIDPVDAAKMAQEFGVKIHTIQVGRGGRVPYPAKSYDFFSGQYVNEVQYAEIPVNPELLRNIADTTKGRYFVASDSGTLKRVFNTIDEMEKTELPGEEFILYNEIYSAFAIPALLLLLFEIFLRLFYFRKFP